MKFIYLHSIFFFLFLFIFIVSCEDKHTILSYSSPSPDTLSTTQGVYYRIDSLTTDTVYFADFPVSFRNYYSNHCATCHSNLWSDSDRRDVLNLNTWQDVQSYGAVTLYLSGKGGGMPPESIDPVPPLVLAQVGQYIMNGQDLGEGPADFTFINFPENEIKILAEKYCGGCHGVRGEKLDDFDLRFLQDWKDEQPAVLEVMLGDGEPMPVDTSDERILWDNNTEEREKLIQWVRDSLLNAVN